jgi:hypothetical protein
MIAPRPQADGSLAAVQSTIRRRVGIVRLA